MTKATPIILNPSDTIAILPSGARAGDDPLQLGAPLSVNIMPGHKIARVAHKSGDAILKFGEKIGVATEDITPGAHVHSHNCAFSDHDQSYQIGCDLDTARAAVPKVSPRSFMGYKRRNGQVGTRNFIALCATVNCSATVIRQAAAELNASGILEQYAHVDGVVGLTHSTGCGMSSMRDFGLLERVLWGYATHPNVGATIFVGLGCEMMQVARMKEIFQAEGQKTNLDHFHSLAIQEVGGTRKTIEAIKAKVLDLLPEVDKARREPCPASALKIALQCGGSDGFSGITANPALGKTADLLAGLGATAILSETPEIYGAEQLLLRRAASQEVADKLIAQIKWWEHYVEINNGSLDNNPSPGNKAGGLTTILEKSLGATAKSGSTPLTAVYDYGEQVTEPGFVYMDTPGYDPVCATGQIAGGAHMVVFTTGRGSAFGSKPAPTIKVATNDRLFEAMPDDMDINCGDILSAGISLDAKGAEILDLILAVASGEPTKSELLGLGDHEFIPWQVGAVM
ncbi:altronate dehydratase [Cohaesibacter sp. CAU 1516]|uniref:UxaA family hydrolase n=1 Tax=Cohaesibacter sp. CAU 1516 TaxID=2576038 RepID=UPI0010FE2C8F|nr:altronate dehydratase family protein [Cohaesibacter sp. CAU 1516]TLP44922.1 altronate dehydratase [Cohaesibacter sp. CAU 1516]